MRTLSVERVPRAEIALRFLIRAREVPAVTLTAALEVAAASERSAQASRATANATSHPRASKKSFSYKAMSFGSLNSYSVTGGGIFTQTATAITFVQILPSTSTFGSGANKRTLYAYDS